MICSECEQLFDAYLDGQLAGSLRLEFDAHRLRCRHCQQTLAMLEAVGHVISSDSQIPELSGDFTDRVMADIELPTQRVIRWPWPRVALVLGGVAQVAAVLVFALVWMSGSSVSPGPQTPSTPVAAHSEPQPVFAVLVDRVSEMCRGAGAEVADLKSALNVPAARTPALAETPDEESPLGALPRLLFGESTPPQAPPQPAAGDGIHSI